jgi:hypothetical protein
LHDIGCPIVRAIIVDEHFPDDRALLQYTPDAFCNSESFIPGGNQDRE